MSSVLETIDALSPILPNYSDLLPVRSQMFIQGATLMISDLEEFIFPAFLILRLYEATRWQSPFFLWCSLTFVTPHSPVLKATFHNSLHQDMGQLAMTYKNVPWLPCENVRILRRVLRSAWEGGSFLRILKDNG